jgi:SPP1 gp7 family putative phage head morphogenesis protein
VSQGKLQATIAKFRQQLIQHESSAEAAINHAHQHTLTVINAQLQRLYQQIADKQKAGETVPLSFLYEQNRLQTIKKLITSQINHFAALAQTQAGQMQHIGVQLGQQSAMQMLQSTVPPGIHYSFGTPHPAAIANLVGATQNGSPLADTFSGYGQEAADKAAKTLITGVTLGNNPRQIAPQVEQALGISRNRALVTSRSMLNQAYRGANLETFRANSDVVTKYRRTCAKNARTCAVCLALDGTLYDLDEDFAVHPCDRCVATPVTKDWSEILGPLGIDTSSIPDTSPVLGMQTGADWLDEQDEATQKQVLGAKYNGWKAGDFSLRDLVHREDDPDWGPTLREKPLKALVK